MNYTVNKKKKKSNVNEIMYFNGYSLPSKNRYFVIEGEKIININIINKKLAHPFISKIVMNKYKRLINKLAELLVSDDDSGQSITEMLNMIEKFKQEIKNKYRKYLKRKELKEMGNKLKFMQKKAIEKQMMLARNYYDINRNINNRSK